MRCLWSQLQDVNPRWFAYIKQDSEPASCSNAKHCRQRPGHRSREDEAAIQLSQHQLVKP